jgi:hypothetical protein
VLVLPVLLGSPHIARETNWMRLCLGEWLSSFLSVATVCFGFPALFWLVVVIIVCPPFPALKLFLFLGSIPFDIVSREGSSAWYKVLQSTTKYQRLPKRYSR